MVCCACHALPGQIPEEPGNPAEQRVIPRGVIAREFTQQRCLPGLKMSFNGVTLIVSLTVCSVPNANRMARAAPVQDYYVTYLER